MEIYTIGFTQKSASHFFSTLRDAGIRRLIDVRINNMSQLSGYSKKEDLEFFLDALLGVEYLHAPQLAPTSELLKAYRDRRLDWQEYERRFLELVEERRIELVLDKNLFDEPTVLLCSEPTQEYCHRRLLVEYLDRRWGDVKSLPL